MKTFNLHIWHIKDDGTKEDLAPPHTMEAVDKPHAEYLVHRMINGHRAWRRLYWHYSLVEAP